MSSAFLAGIALLMQGLMSQAFVDDSARWQVVNPAPVVDVATGTVWLSVEPSEDVGCAHPRVLVDYAQEVIVACYCQDADGTPTLMFTLGTDSCPIVPSVPR